MSFADCTPELFRNIRIQLRPGRIIAAAVICAVGSLTLFTFELRSFVSSGRDVYSGSLAVLETVLFVQIAVLLLGGGIYCLQSVHREKELNTFDYQRVTRLSPMELALGKLFGAPALAYFIVLCLMPAALVAAFLVGLKVSVFLKIYSILFFGSVAYHGLALLISLLLPRGSSAGGILLFLLLVAMSSIDYFESWQSVFAVHGLSPFFADSLLRLSISAAPNMTNGIANPPPWKDLFFGVSVSHVLALLVIYVIFTAWFLLALGRNIKRDPSAYEVYSPVQAFGFVLYLNFLLLGFFHWARQIPIYKVGTDKQWHYLGNRPIPFTPSEAQTNVLSVSLWLFLVLGLVLLRNRDDVRRRVRELGTRAATWWAGIWPAPYLLAGTIIVGLAILMMIRSRIQPLNDWNLGMGFFEVGVFALWVVRDLLYLQCMNLRRACRPLASAVLYLIVFYACSSSLFYAFGHYKTPARVAYSTAFIPSAAFRLSLESWTWHRGPWIFALIALIVEAGVLAWLHGRELRALWAVTSVPPSAP